VFAIVVCASAVGCLVGDLLLFDYFGLLILVPLSLLSFAIVGSLLVVRRAGGPIGWLLAVAGALFGPLCLSAAYGTASFEPGAGLPGGELTVWLGRLILFVSFGCVASAMVLFPDGRPPGHAIRILFWAFVAFLSIGVVSLALADTSLQVPRPNITTPPRSIPNPFAVRGPLRDAILLTADAFNRITVPWLVAPIALVVRFRRSRGVEREQLKWLMYTTAMTFGLLVILVLTPRGAIADLAVSATLVGIGLIPVAIGLAIFRYRLYDIDVLIRRTIIYAALSAVLVAAYLVGLALFQAILAPITSGSAVAVAVSTLAVVALFQPVRTRIQRVVDRRFYRSRYDAARTLDAFSLRLRSEVDLESVRTELLDAVGTTLNPIHASVWLRETPR
jgi:hypothetical protein